MGFKSSGSGLAARTAECLKIPSSGRFSIIEVAHSRKSLPARYLTTWVDRAVKTLQQAILQPLMITLFVIVRHVVRQRAFKR